MIHGRKELQILKLFLKISPFIMNVYRAISENRLKNYLFKLTYDYCGALSKKVPRGEKPGKQRKKEFLADFYKYSLLGLCWTQLDGDEGGYRGNH